MRTCVAVIFLPNVPSIHTCVLCCFAAAVVMFPMDILENGIFGTNFSMLGLGDIVIPGIFIALLCRFDHRLVGGVMVWAVCVLSVHMYVHIYIWYSTMSSVCIVCTVCSIHNMYCILYCLYYVYYVLCVVCVLCVYCTYILFVVYVCTVYTVCTVCTVHVYTYVLCVLCILCIMCVCTECCVYNGV